MVSRPILEQLSMFRNIQLYDCITYTEKCWSFFYGCIAELCCLVISLLSKPVLDIYCNIPPIYLHLIFEITSLKHPFQCKATTSKKIQLILGKKSSSSNWICSNLIFQIRYFKMDLQKNQFQINWATYLTLPNFYFTHWQKLQHSGWREYFNQCKLTAIKFITGHVVYNPAFLKIILTEKRDLYLFLNSH